MSLAHRFSSSPAATVLALRRFLGMHVYRSGAISWTECPSIHRSSHNKADCPSFFFLLAQDVFPNSLSLRSYSQFSLISRCLVKALYPIIPSLLFVSPVYLVFIHIY